MAKYRVLEKSFINNAIVEAGVIVEYAGKPGSNLELVKGSKAKGAEVDRPGTQENTEGELV